MCLSVTTFSARVLISAVQTWYERNQRDTLKVFNSWILLKVLCSKVMALFTFSIGAAICDILPVSSLYSHDDTDMMTFVIMVMLTTVVRSAVTEEDWLSFCNTLKRTLERLTLL